MILNQLSRLTLSSQSIQKEIGDLVHAFFMLLYDEDYCFLTELISCLTVLCLDDKFTCVSQQLHGENWCLLCTFDDHLVVVHGCS